jgi:ABC-type branched-subunit amino acid transport system substrate-binding protein
MPNVLGIFTCFLVTALFVFVASQNPPVIKLGRTFSGSGNLSIEGAPIANGIRFWYEYLQNNSNGGIVNNGVFYKVQLVEYDDASAYNNVDTLYRALVEFDNVTALFGPWSTVMTAPAIDRSSQSSTPFVFSGASAPQFFTGRYNHSVGTLIQVGQRLLPCVKMYAALGANSSAIISTTDTFQLTTYGILQNFAAANNLTSLYNTTHPTNAAAAVFEPIVNVIAQQKPDIIFSCQADVDFVPFLRRLRKVTVEDAGGDPSLVYQPKAIFNTNSVSATVAYAALGWAADKVFAGDQWAPTLPFSDPRFNSTAGFTAVYSSWLRMRGFNYSIGYTDAASVLAGFVMQAALENAASLSKSDIIAALHRVGFSTTFMGPVSFSAAGELAGTGLCRQVLPPQNSTAKGLADDVRELAVVAPASVATQNVSYPAPVIPPPLVGLSPSQTTLVIVLSVVGGLLVIAVLVALVVLLVRHKFAIIFIPKGQTNAEWGSQE